MFKFIMAGTPPPHPSNKAEPRQLQKKNAKRGWGQRTAAEHFSLKRGELGRGGTFSCFVGRQGLLGQIFGRVCIHCAYHGYF